MLVLKNGPIYKLLIEGFDEPLECKLLNEASSTKSESSSRQSGLIESYIISDFDGLDQGNIYHLANGQIWEQTEFWIWIWIWINPRVTIWESGGVYKMKVENIDHEVTVRRLK